MPLEVLLLLIAIVGGLTAWIVYQILLIRKFSRFHQLLRAENPLFSLGAFGCQSSITTLNGASRAWRSCMIALTDQDVTLYPLSRNMDERVRFPLAGLRWFGRPVKYHNDRNELWLHFEQNREWKLVKLRLWRHPMQDMIRALKTVTPPELVTAYRRHRPYIHQGPISAQPAEQNIYGAWALDDPVSLYVMPLYVVILRGREVLRLLPLERIWQIAALRRLDEPEADGLVSLNFEGEKLAYAVKDYEGVAAAISEAAKRSLEEPVMQKQKKKDEYDDEEWE
jgi:hypothetical protein